jgi:DNA-binding LacI/PurR family transcriptional regulator
MPTVRKLAEIAGVSIGTVSMALRDDPRVKPATRRRIQDLAAQYNYHPNRLTQSLLTGQSTLLGCIVPRVVEYSGQVLSGFLQRTRQAGFQTLIFESHNNVQHLSLAISALIEQRVAGVAVFCGVGHPVSRASILALHSHNIPLVLIDNVETTIPCPGVISDEHQMARLGWHYLSALGHRHIGVVSVPSLRQEAFLLEAARRQDATALYAIPRGRALDELAPHLLDELVARYQATNPRPTALVMWNDSIAAQWMRHALRYGINVPRDVSVLGCGNETIARYLSPPLTTIDQHPEQVGAMAYEALSTMLASGTPVTDCPPTIHTVPATLVERESCRRQA